MGIFKLLIVLTLNLNLVFSPFLVSGVETGDESVDSILKNWEERQSSQQSESDTFGPFTIQQKLQFYNKDKGILISSVPEIKFLSKINRAPPSQNDTGPNGQDLGIHWTVAQLIENASPDFRVKVHKVRTNDSYILTLFQIKNIRCERTGPPTFFQHGFLGTAADWLLLDPSYVLPFRLAKSGYDVWLGNSRGNQYSREHAFLSTKHPKYWNFSFHEMGTQDCPAIIDYILDYTKEPKLNYVGHGLGTTIFYVCLSENPDQYNHKIRAMFGFGPMAFLSRAQSPIKYLTPLVKIYKDIPDSGPLLPSTISSYLQLHNPELCRIMIHGRSLCSDVLFFIYGADTQNTVGKKVVRRIFGHSPSTTSIKTFIHLLQLFSFNSFRQFDYGLVKNSLIYSQTVPPKYNLFLIETPTLNYYGQRDLLIDRKDAEQTVSELGTGAFKLNIQVNGFDLTGFLYSEYFILANGPEIEAYLFGEEEDLGTRLVEKGIQKQKLETCTCRGQCHMNNNNNNNNKNNTSSESWEETSYFKQFQTHKHKSPKNIHHRPKTAEY